MKAPAGYETLAAQRWPILQQIKYLQTQLKAIDAPMVAQLEEYYRKQGWASPDLAAANELKKLHLKFDPK